MRARLRDMLRGLSAARQGAAPRPAAVAQTPAYPRAAWSALAAPPPRAGRPAPPAAAPAAAAAAAAAAEPAPPPPADLEPDADSAAGAAAVLEPGLSWPARTRGAGELRAADAGAEVTLCGWVDRARDLGGLLFLDVRDHTGVAQVVVDPSASPALAAKAARLRSEWVVAATGAVRARRDPNPRLATGAVEVAATSISVLNAVSRKLPFPVSEAGADAGAPPPREELRLRHRVLDLRRPAMLANLRLRHAALRAARRHLEDSHGFLEVETPVLTRSTPEGARDYLVPSRVQPGAVYALPQSPQVFKQLLMAAGVDRYYQVGGAACSTVHSTIVQLFILTIGLFLVHALPLVPRRAPAADRPPALRRSRAASATRTCVRTGSLSSRSSTSRPRGWARTRSWRSPRASWPRSSPRPRAWRSRRRSLG
jgi:hypothetical protein